LTFDEDIGSTLRKACNDTMHLAHTAQIVCKEMFEKNIYLMDPLSHHVNKMSYHHLPPSLMALVRMIFDGPNIKHQFEVVATTTRAVLSISQLLMFNSVNMVEM